MLAESVVLICLFAYFLCVVSAYQELMHGPQDDEEKKEEEENKEGEGETAK